MAQASNVSDGTQFLPTLLVGIGGIGCQIAEKVLKMAEESGMLERSRVAIMGFDTDVNDINKVVARGLMDERNIFRTSPNGTVGEVLLSQFQNFHNWFVPLESLTAEIRGFPLHIGAGQIRMLSRLAFYVAMQDPAIASRIKQAIKSLTSAKGSAGQPVFTGPMNVMLVGTLAGGTGSGMFLQAALYLGELLKTGGCTPELRGLFLLPDVMVHAAGLQENQIEPVKANAHAAVRELHSILMQTAGRSTVPVTFEYCPGMSLKKDALPFKSITFIDYETDDGGTLSGGLSAYLELASRAAYELLLTPIGGRAASIGANDVRSKLAAAGPQSKGDLNYYSGLGLSAVVYPTEDILDYLSLRYATRALSDEWLLFDQNYYREVQLFEKRKNARVTGERAPARAELYVRDLDQAASQGIAFFRETRSIVHHITQDPDGNELVENRCKTFLDAFEAEVSRAFWTSDKELLKFQNNPGMIDKERSKIDMVRRMVYDSENTLKKWSSLIQDAIRNRPSEIFRNTSAYGETAAPADWKAYHLQSYILRQGVHPVGVRYFLYSLLELIQENLRALKDAKANVDAQLKTLRDKFDDKINTKNYTETAVDRLSELAREPQWKHLLKGHIKQFAKDYCKYFNDMMKALRLYAELTVKEILYNLLLLQLKGEEGKNEVKGLLPVFEAFFDALRELSRKLELETKANLAHYGARSTKHGSNVYVYADSKAKEDLEQRLAGAFSSSLGASGVSLAVITALYDRYRMGRDKGNEDIVQPFDPESLFRREVLEDHCRKNLEENYGAMYRLTAAEAIYREASLRGKDKDKHLVGVLNMVSKQSKVLVNLTEDNPGDSVVFWALSPNNVKHLGDIDGLLGGIGTSPLVEPDFRDNELLCFSMRVNLTPSDFLKFNSRQNIGFTNTGSPVYYDSYRKMIDAIHDFERAGGKGVSGLFTPHLDKSWHIPGVLPELTKEETEGVEVRLRDAFVLAIATGRFERTDIRKNPVTYYIDWTRPGQSDERRLLAKSINYLDIMEAFFRDYAAIEATFACADEWRKKLLISAEDSSISAQSPEESALFKGLSAPATLFALASLGFSRKDPSARELASSTVKRLYENLRGFLRETRPELPPIDLVGSTVGIIQNQVDGIKTLEEFRALPGAVKKDIEEMVKVRTVSSLWDNELVKAAK